MSPPTCGLVALLWGLFCGIWGREWGRVRERARWATAIRRHYEAKAAPSGSYPLLVPLDGTSDPRN
jgi:hypothetical protein